MSAVCEVPVSSFFGVQPFEHRILALPLHMSPEPSPIPLIVARARQGDRAAQRALYEQHVDQVFGFCLRFCRGDREAAQDLTQEAFVRAFTALPELRDAQAFPKWLMTTTRRCCLRWIERRQREAAAVERMVHEPRPIASRGDRAQRIVAEVIEACPDPKLREAALLFYREPPHTTDEIAERLGLSRTAVTTRLMRFRAWAKQRMMGRLAAALEEEGS
jgi:RNA polymerase sigma-70 factor (ECF subfamily)